MLTDMMGLIEWIASGFAVFIVLIFIIKGFCLIGANEVGILTKNMLGKKMPEGQIIARQWGDRGPGEDFDAGALLENAYNLVVYQNPGSNGR